MSDARREESQRERSIFDALMELAGDGRAAAIERLCEGDAAFMERMRALIARAERIDDVLDRTPALPEPTAPLREPSAVAGDHADSAHGATLGDRVGAFRLVELIGEGGFGEVYRAEQGEPVKREVAIKILKAGMDTRALIRRFRLEMQALARMKSPNIATVHEAGATPAGRPYFVMELVRGEHITRFCDEHRLSIGARIELFLQVCDAVQHAHHKGVFHRDIKPSNVLVTEADGAPSVKVIDFGIAKAAAGEDEFGHSAGEQQAERTIAGQPIGTLGYMSPEQVAGSPDIDARTDVYSLGVLLYELLTGATPLSWAGLRGASYAEIHDFLCHRDVPRPSEQFRTDSAALESIARCRGLAPQRLRGSLRGDLEWVLARALEIDRARRYATVGDLAADLRRHLRNQPLDAGPPSRRYRIQKFARRNRGLVIGGAAVALALSIGVAGTIAGLVRARAAEREAIRKREEAEYIALFQSHMLREMNTEVAGRELIDDFVRRFDSALAKAGIDDAGRSTRSERLRGELDVVNATDVAASMIDRAIVAPSVRTIEEVEIEPAIAAPLRHTLGLAYRRLGLSNEAIREFEIALSLSRQAFGDDAAVTLDILDSIGVAKRDAGDVDGAVGAFRELVERRTRLQGPASAEVALSKSNLAAALLRSGKIEEADTLAGEALAAVRTLADANAQAVTPQVQCDVRRWRGEAAMAMGRVDEAMVLFDEAAPTAHAELGPDHPLTLQIASARATAFMRLGKFAEAEAPIREALTGFRRTLGDGHPTTLKYIANLAAILSFLDKRDEAESLAREAFARTTRLYGAEHPETIETESNLARLLQVRGRIDEALPLHVEAYGRARRIFGEDHPRTLAMGGNLGAAYLVLDRLDDAKPILLDVHQRRMRLLPERDPNRALSYLVLGVMHRSLGELEQSRLALEQAVAERKANLPEHHPDTLFAMESLAATLRELGLYENAGKLLAETLQAYAAMSPPNPLGRANAEHEMAEIALAEGRLDDAARLFEAALTARNEALGPEHPDALASHRGRAAVALAAGEYARAEQSFGEVLERLERTLGPTRTSTIEVRALLADSIARGGDFVRAETTLEPLLALREAGSEPVGVAEKVGRTVARIYDAWVSSATPPPPERVAERRRRWGLPAAGWEK